MSGDVLTEYLDVAGRPLAPEDDFVHGRPEGVELWTENIQWNIYGVLRHRRRLARSARCFVAIPDLWHIVAAVLLPDGTVLTDKIVSSGIGAFGSAASSLETIEPYRRWRFDSAVECRSSRWNNEHWSRAGRQPHSRVDRSRLEAAYPVWIPAGSSTHGEWGRFHHEQPVRATGEVVIDGQRHRS